MNPEVNNKTLIAAILEALQHTYPEETQIILKRAYAAAGREVQVLRLANRLSISGGDEKYEEHLWAVIDLEPDGWKMFEPDPDADHHQIARLLSWIDEESSEWRAKGRDEAGASQA